MSECPKHKNLLFKPVALYLTLHAILKTNYNYIEQIYTVCKQNFHTFKVRKKIAYIWTEIAKHVLFEPLA